MITVSIDDPVVAVGEMLTGRVHWKADDSRRVRHILVAAQWHTSGEGNRAFGVGRGTRFDLRPDQREAEFPLRLLIPYEGPISFQGELVSVNWKIWVRLDRLGFDEVGGTDFRVEPRRRTRASRA